MRFRTACFFAWMCWSLICLCFAGAPGTAYAAPKGLPVIDLQAQREHLSLVDKNWRFHTGDNPHWADPNLDDRAWTLIQPDQDWTPQGYRETDGLAWFRFQLLVPAHTPSLLLALPSMEKNYQIFAQGRLIGQAGTLPPAKTALDVGADRLFSVPMADVAYPQTVTFALRLWFPPYLAGLRSSVLQGPAYAGERGPVANRFGMEKSVGVLGAGSDYTRLIFAFVVGAASLLLFLLTRETTYLWFVLYCLCSMVYMPFEFALEHYAGSFTWRVFVQVGLDGLSYLLLSLFIFDALQVRSRRLRLLQAVFIMVSVMSVLLVLWHALSLFWGDLLFFLAILGIYAVLVAVTARGWRARKADAALLFLTVLLDSIAPNLFNLEKVLEGLHIQLPKFDAWSDVTLLEQPFHVAFHDLRDILVFLCFLAVLMLRFGRTNREKQRLATALQAAHDVQQQLVHVHASENSDLQTELVYLAAEEVGGDFCQVLPRADGSILVTIGDVSGKGLHAAMMGTLLVGALRSLAEEGTEPAVTLQRLNDVVLRTEYSGFITCLCLLISAGGAVSLANAGHLLPYLNGREVSLDSGLPLGLVADAEYAQSELQLAPNARLTLLSDGVVEARSARGELFGFERTLELSQRPASEIAAAARHHGQEDDITILTLDWAATAKATLAA